MSYPELLWFPKEFVLLSCIFRDWDFTRKFDEKSSKSWLLTYPKGKKKKKKKRTLSDLIARQILTTTNVKFL